MLTTFFYKNTRGNILFVQLATKKLLLNINVNKSMKMMVKGYNEDRKVICQDTIILKVPNKI